MTEFMAKLTDDFDVDSGQVRIAQVPYSDDVHKVTHLMKLSTNEAVRQEILSTPYKRGKTATGT